jgi:predicted enzyme related to lactoylglutathione lyase
MLPAFDVLGAGRMALVRDPQGAIFALWEPRAHIGAGLVNDPGAMVLNQLNTSDPEGAASFYAELFGWRITQVASEPQAYWGIENGGSLNGGVMALPPGTPAPPHWLVYFTAAHPARGGRGRAAGRAHPVRAHPRRARPPGGLLRPVRGRGRPLSHDR